MSDKHLTIVWYHTLNCYVHYGIAPSRVIHTKALQFYNSTPRVPLSESAGISMQLPPRGFLSEATACYTEQVRQLYRERRENHPLYRTGYEVTVIPNRSLTQAPSALKSVSACLKYPPLRDVIHLCHPTNKNLRDESFHS